MAKLTWDDEGKRLYETGVDHGVLFPYAEGKPGKGVAWNGLTAVNEQPSGAESNAKYADNMKYLDLFSAEEFGCTIEAFTYPDEFAACDGSEEIATGVFIGQQARKTFGFSYRTKIGNDTEGEDHGYKLHLVYGCKAQPSERNRETINDSPDAINFSWECKTTPVVLDGHKPVSHIEIDSTKVDKDKLKKLEDKLYGGTGSGDPTLPMPAEVLTMFTT